MIIRCNRCENKIDLKTYLSIQSFTSGCPIECPKCKDIIFYREEEK